MKLQIPIFPSMADCTHTHTQIQAFHSPHGDRQLFQDSVPLDDTVPVDGSLVETQLKKLDFDTELVDDSDCVEDARLQLASACEKEVVLDSEDEGVCQSKLVSVANELSGVESGRGIKGNVVDLQKRHLSPPPQDLAEDSDGSASERCGAGGQEFARLNYVASEEPGESSQASALDFVDHFLSSNDLGLSPGAGPRSSVGRKVSPVSSAKGPQLLAKRIKTRTPVGKNGYFDWVNGNRHAGAEPFSMTYDVSFDCRNCQQRSVVRQQKGGLIGNQGGCSSGNECKEKSLSLHKEVTGSPHSDSKAAVQGAEGTCRIEQASGMNSENNSVNKPNELSLAASSGQELDVCSIERNTADMFDVGFNTQMAAEVMETLSYGPSAHPSADDVYQGPQNFLVDSSQGVTKSQVHFKRTSPRNGVLSNINGIPRVSKQSKHSAKKVTPIPSWKHNSHQELDHEVAITTKRRSKHLVGRVNGRNSIHKSKSSAKKSQKPIEGRKEDVAVSRNNIKDCEYCGGSSKLVGNISLHKQQIQGEPVGQQNGHWMTGANLKRMKDGSDNQKARTNDVRENSIITYKRKRSCLGAKPSEMLSPTGRFTELCFNTSMESRNNGLSQQKQASLFALSSIVTYKRKRSCVGAKPSVALSPTGKFTELCFDTSGNARNNDLSQQKQTCLSSLNSSNRTSNQCTPFTTVEGKEHHKKQFSKNLPKSSPLKELIKLGIPDSKPDFAWKDLRKRRDMAYARVLFSQHLDDDIIKKQRKLLVRLGISIASCSMDATHFIADRFARTRNMLEAIALGKPVVTHLWLKSCGQASCLIDEKNYILRDAKKEKEIGFCLPVSLARANQRPLLKGHKVLITPNVKPDKETIASLVKIVQGQVVEKSQMSALKMPDDLLIVSCQGDYAFCVPFLDNGAAVYNSELLLNGIVIQKLEYERHQLFTSPVKRNCPSKRRSEDHGEFLVL